MASETAVTDIPLHRPVLLAEVIAALDVRPEGVYVDGTLVAADMRGR